MTMLVAGIDEVGRGPLAGPVVAAAVILRVNVEGIGDSKAIPARRREALMPLIYANAWVGIGAASVQEIEQLNILQASFVAMRRAVARLPVRPQHLLIDGNQRPKLDLAPDARMTCIIGGDGCEPAIGAASIVAKVMRDRWMARLALRFPVYGFERNAGYGTREHMAALQQHGPTPQHRAGFAPIAQLLLAI